MARNTFFKGQNNNNNNNNKAQHISYVIIKHFYNFSYRKPLSAKKEHPPKRGIFYTQTIGDMNKIKYETCKLKKPMCRKDLAMTYSSAA